MENDKPRKFFFRNTKERPDVLPEDATPTLGYFFKLLKRKFGKLLSLNLMMAFLYLPMIVAVVIYLLGDTTPTVESALYAPLMGVAIGGGSPTANLLLGTFGQQLNVPILTTGRTVAIALLTIFTLLTWGWQNVGATYNLRSLVRGDSTFLWSDYFYAIRRNLKQGFLFGLLDVLVIVVLAFDFFYFSALSDVLLFGVMYILFIALALIYTVMRFYIYHMMITFDLSIRKILKNALIFTALGIKRNLMAALGIVLCLALWAALGIVGLQYNLGFLFFIPAFIMFALIGFISVYAAYPIIKKHMIDPVTVNNDTADQSQQD